MLQFDILENILRFACIGENVNINVLKVQIETFRFLRFYLHSTPTDNRINEILLEMKFLLQWHYHHLKFEQEDHFILRSHATALIYLISCVRISIFDETLKMCASKWFYMATQYGADEFSQKMLLSSLLNTHGLSSNESLYDFIDGYLIKFFSSISYRNICENLANESLLIKKDQNRDRSKVLKSLPNVGFVILDSKSGPKLIISGKYPVILMEALLTFVENIRKINQNYYEKLKEKLFENQVKDYLIIFSELSERPSLASNWFSRTEIIFIYKLLMSTEVSQNNLQIVFNLVDCLTCDSYQIALKLFQEIIFNERIYEEVSRDEIGKWKWIFNGVIEMKATGFVSFIFILHKPI